jgi:hypothetical protein
MALKYPSVIGEHVGKILALSFFTAVAVLCLPTQADAAIVSLGTGGTNPFDLTGLSTTSSISGLVAPGVTITITATDCNATSGQSCRLWGSSDGLGITRVNSGGTEISGSNRQIEWSELLTVSFSNSITLAELVLTWVDQNDGADILRTAPTAGTVLADNNLSNNAGYNGATDTLSFTCGANCTGATFTFTGSSGSGSNDSFYLKSLGSVGFDSPVTHAPEPGTYVLFGSGLLLVAIAARSRRRRN